MEIDIRDPAFVEKTMLVNALDKVIDPELNISIIDLGLVYDLRVDVRAKRIDVDMTLSSPACPMAAMLTGHVKIAANGALPGFDTTVHLVWEPKWNADHISEAGRSILGW
ncbi:metal-sulfur cluster assembly factor [Chitinophaga flava]|nr:metal-sulfur cluster assembly factor [Chitinophaga flava]